MLYVIVQSERTQLWHYIIIQKITDGGVMNCLASSIGWPSTEDAHAAAAKLGYVRWSPGS